ncbi:MAG: PD-(D/E)XK nuclease family protein, partial [Candidatus Omnitrophica bacterium]|nr:PD-(D/E)XK nuclease family protein [Candidatus Omnitrophota bacterium]
IDDYLTCPLKYKYVHILRIPIMRHHSVVYGNAVHKAISNFYQAKSNKRNFDSGDLINSFQSAWVNEGFLSRAHEEQRLGQGKITLKRFYEREKDKTAPAYVEQEFSFVLGNDKVLGRWDRIDRTPEGTVIIDFKTSDIVKKQKQADKRVKESLQLSIYALAYNIIKGELPARVEFHFVDTGLVGCGRRTAGDLEKSRELIREVSVGIRAREFPPRPKYSACKYCAYGEVCPHTK